MREWVLEDFGSAASELRGRSFTRGKRLFRQATCYSCHTMGHSGGRLGPDLTGLAIRMAEKPDPLRSLLTEVLDPSAVIDPKYGVRVFVLESGKTVSGVVVSEDEQAVRLAADPAQPEYYTEVSRSEIDEEFASGVSMMPAGLLDTYHRDEVLDLLAYLQSGGDPVHAVYSEED